MSLRVLMVTSEWPTPENPTAVPFVVREAESLTRAGIELDVFHFRGGFRPDNYFRAWLELRRVLSSAHYDLLHAQFGQSGLLAIFPRSHPLVVTYQGSDLNGIVDWHGRQTLRGSMLRRVSKLVAFRADEIILVSQELACHLPNRNYHVIPGGLDLDLFRPIPQSQARQALNLSPNARYVLFTGGRRNPIKRFHLAEKAVLRIRDVELLVAEGVPPHEMPLYLNASDALLLTSTREGSPNVVKEALACNLPVVSVDVGDVRQRLQGMSGCTVCDDDDAQTIAAALCEVLGKGGRIEGRKAVSHLDLRHTTEQIIDIYHKALATS